MQGKGESKETKDTKEDIREDWIDRSPGLDNQGAMRRMEEEGYSGSPCGYCNRGDCIECAFAY